MLYSLVRRLLCLAALAGTLTLSAADAPSFRDQQWKFPRVRVAASEKDQSLRQLFAQKGLAYPAKAILLRACKKEALLELWT